MTVQSAYETRGAASAAPVRLLVAISSQDDTERVLPWAQSLARTLAMPLTIAYVLDPGRQRESVDVAEAMVRDFLSLVRHDVRLAGLTVETQVMVGLRQEELPDLAVQKPGTLLMIPGGERGGTVPALLGMGDESILHALTEPFIVVPPGARDADGLRRVIAGTDRSDAATAVLDAARSIAVAAAVPATAVEVIAPESLPAHQFTAIEPAFDDERVVLRGRGRHCWRWPGRSTRR